MSRSTTLRNFPAITTLLLLISLPAASALQFDEPTHHFGKVYNADPLEHTWVLHNDQDQAVRIQKVSLGCDVCMEYTLENNTLAPDQSVTLTVWLNAANLEGAVRKEVLVKIDRPRDLLYKLALEAFVMQPYRVEPGALRIHFGKEPTPVVRALRIQPRQALKGTLSAVNASERVHTELHALENGSYELALTIQPGWPIGISTLDLRLESNHPDDPACLAHLIVSQSGEIEVLPPEITLASGTAAQSRMLFVKSDWKRCGALKMIKSGKQQIAHRIDRAARPGEYRVFIEFSDKTAALDGLELHFDQGQVAQVAMQRKGGDR